MKAMILAAGRGERLRPLTDHTPKPLLQVGSCSLIEHHLHALAGAGFRDIVINLAHLRGLITQALGNGERYGVAIEYADEGDEALETAGGVRAALGLLGEAPFALINADIWTDYPRASLRDRLQPKDQAHVVLIDNPEHHPAGDFACVKRRALNAGMEMLTYSGIGVFRPQLFAHLPLGKCPLRPILQQAIAHNRVSAEHYRGSWVDVGTPERLALARLIVGSA